MVKIKRNNQQRKPLLAKLEQGGLGGSFQPAARPAYDKNAQLYREANDALGKIMKFLLEFTEGLMDEVFDVKIGSKKRRRTVRKVTRF